MKKQRYIVEIEMPDGDFISAGWLKDLIQADCDVEDEDRKKVTVQETSLPSDLDEAAEEYAWQNTWLDQQNTPTVNEHLCSVESFKAGAEWMAGQGETFNGYISMKGKRSLIVIEGKSNICKFGDKVVVQIRKK